MRNIVFGGAMIAVSYSVFYIFVNRGNALMKSIIFISSFLLLNIQMAGALAAGLCPTTGQVTDDHDQIKQFIKR